METIREYYEKPSNPIYAFIVDICVQDGVSNIPCNDFYHKLMVYCEEKRLSKPTLTYTTQELKRQNIEKTRLSEEGNPYAYHGLRWKTEEERQEEVTLDDYQQEE